MSCLAVNRAVTIGAFGPAIVDVRPPSPGPPDCDWVIALVGILPAQLTFDPATGAVALVAGPAGTYSFQWRFTQNGSTATATVTYDPGCVVVARPVTVTTLLTGLVIADVRANDTTCGLGSLTVVGSLPPELQFDTATGTVTLIPTAALGTYTFTYRLEDTANALVTVVYASLPFVPSCACPA